MITIETLETASRGDRSYVAADGEVAVVVDPQRDIDRVVSLVAERGLRVTHVLGTHVLGTHVHNDYVTGGLELSRVTGAAYVLAAGSGVAFDHVAVEDEQVLESGQLRLRVLRTPRHTHAHVSCSARPAGRTWSVRPTPTR